MGAGSGSRIVIFDTDGTLVDSRRVIIDAVAEGLRDTYRHFALPVADPDRERIALAMGLPSTAFFRTAFAPETVPHHLRAPFAGEFEVRATRAELAALRRGESLLYAHAEATLAALRQEGYELALFSNAGQLYFQAVIEVHRLHRWFSRTLSLEMAVRRRLARDKVGMVRFLARDRDEVSVVGDRSHDIEAGRAVGAVTVACRYGFGEPAELAMADHIIDSLTELPHLVMAATRCGVENCDRRGTSQD